MKLNKMVETLNEIVYALKQHKIVINLFVLTFLHFDIFYGISTKILINMQQANKNQKTIIIVLIDRLFEYYQVAILSRNKDIFGSWIIPSNIFNKLYLLNILCYV